MDSFSDQRDIKVLENDKYTFFVLRNTVGQKCELLLTDHKRLIICHTVSPYPIWIWTPDDVSATEMENAYRLISEHFLLNGKYRFNLKYNLAQYFIKRAVADGITQSIITNMYAYDCQCPIEPTQRAEGSIHQCISEDIEELADFIDLFHKETGIDQKNRDDYQEDAKVYIQEGTMYFWTDEQGNHVASCKYTPNGDMASINLVYTRPECRRMYYANHLVYEVTKLVIDAGYVPMLYTDADYVASNACYEKIGYVLRGRLCTLG